MKSSSSLLKMCATILLIIIATLEVYAASSTIFTVGTVECYAGDTITVPICITQNMGFSRARLAIKYDDEIFTLLQEATDKKLISGNFHSNKLESPYKLSWEVASDDEDTYVEGLVAELTFKVSPTAKQGKYKIEIIIMDNSVISSDGKNVETQGIDGNIYIVQNPTNCSHSWGTWLSKSIKNHKRTCRLCSEIELEKHSWDDGEVTKEPTVDSSGITTYTCSICSATKTEAIPPISKPTIPGDISGDGVLDYFDVTALYAAYQSGEVDAEIMDVNHDGVVDYYDVSKLYAAFRGTATLT